MAPPLDPWQWLATKGDIFTWFKPLHIRNQEKEEKICHFSCYFFGGERKIDKGGVSRPPPNMVNDDNDDDGYDCDHDEDGDDNVDDVVVVVGDCNSIQQCL